jgi:hypothetical protein
MEGTELAAAAAEARVACEADADGDTRLRALYAEEGERVAEAIALAEVLIPALSERLTSLGAVQAPAAVAPRRTDIRGTAADEPGIADFIDEMLAQDRAHSR